MLLSVQAATFVCSLQFSLSKDDRKSETLYLNCPECTLSLLLCAWCVICSLADTYSDGLGNLDFERSQLGSGMSQRSAAKRLVNALHAHSQRTNQTQFDLQTLRSVADRMKIKVNKQKHLHHLMNFSRSQ